MNTFKAWLIANMEYFFLASCVVWTLLAGLFFGKEAFSLLDGLSSNGTPGFVFLVIFVFLGMENFPSLPTHILVFALIVGIAVFLILRHPSSAFWIIPILLAATAASILTSVVCARNFREVVSRRTLFRNSQSELFSIKWKYVIDRFLYAFRAFVFFVAFVIFTTPGLWR